MLKRILLFILPVAIGSAHAQKADITLEDIWLNFKYYGNGIDDLRSMNDGMHYTIAEGGRNGNNVIARYAYKNGQKTGDLLSLDATVAPIRYFDSYTFSADENKVLLSANTEHIYRHSSRADFYIYDLSTKKWTRLFEQGKVLYPVFSPAGDKVAFIFGNNLYYRDLNSNTVTTVTTDGKANEIINGLPDWVYEEEFTFFEAYKWSPDGKNIAYLRFNEKEVPSYTMPVFGNSLYPENYVFKYPKVGEKNSIVELYNYGLDSKKASKISLKGSYEYIPRFSWINASELAVFVMPRLQNELNILKVGLNGSGSVIYSEKADTYIEISDDFSFLSNGFVIKSEKDGFYHLYMYDYNGEQKSAITSGNFEVTALLGVDEANGMVYYTAALPDPMNRQVYRASLDGKKKELLTPAKGKHDVKFSSNYKYFIDSHSDLNTPPAFTLYDEKGKAIRVLEDNNQLKSDLKKLNLNAGEFYSFTTSENVQLNGWMIKPANFDPAKKYPVLMYVYGGPGSQEALNEWGGFNYMWFQMLAQKGYLIACVDNRGTGGRGKAFRTATYKKLGYLETSDQMEAAQWLGKQSYVDARRIGIFGWSYGGYMSSLCITRGADVFSAAIAVAPVSNWKFYDNIYTERYMGTFETNPNGYDDNAPINFVKKLKGNYFLVHGTADDNVHWQNAAVLSKALVDNNKQFEQFIYTDKNHGIYGGYTRFHLYTKMTDFLLKNL